MLIGLKSRNFLVQKPRLFKSRNFSTNNSSAQHHKVLIVGGGSGGLGVAAQLKRELKGESNIAILEPKSEHYYQPLWTLVGGGLADKESSKRPEANCIPSGIKWIKGSAAEFHPESNEVITEDGQRVTYDYMVVAAGIELDLDRIKGLKETLGKNGVTTNYLFDTAPKTSEFIKDFKKGTAIFTFPDTPVKCAGAAQKIMWLAEAHWRKQGVGKDINITYTMPGEAIFAVKKYSDMLTKIAQERNVNLKPKHLLVEVRGNSKEIVLRSEGKDVVTSYDLLHVTPPMQAPKPIRTSSLAASTGFVDVDSYTLQHKKFKNIYSLGDCANLPTSKTLAALTQQVPVLVTNLVAEMNNKGPQVKYNGYTSCPITIGDEKLLLAEFGYENKIMESQPWNRGTPSGFLYWVKKYIFLPVYWHLYLKGLWYGPSLVFKPKLAAAEKS